jgi:hypothetical protein
MNSSVNQGFSMQRRTAALALVTTSVVVLFALLHHPIIERSSGLQDSLAQMVALQGQDNLVHGTLIAMLGILAWSFSIFGQLLGAQRSFVIAAGRSYYIGCGALITAMLFDGFVLPHFAARFVERRDGSIDAVFVVLQFLGSVVQVFSKAGFLAMSAAILCWAFVLVRSPQLQRWMRVSGAIGAVVALIPAVALSLVAARLAPGSLLATFAMYAFWNLVAAAILVAPVEGVTSHFQAQAVAGWGS